jgi:hypothetical protein
MLSIHSYLCVVDESVGSIVEPVSEEGFLSVEVSITSVALLSSLVVLVPSVSIKDHSDRRLVLVETF